MKQNYNLSTRLDGAVVVWKFFSPKTSFSFLPALLLTFFGLSDTFGQSPTVFTTSGTFTVPQGVTSITIDCIGAGGSGGSGRGNNNQGAGGGAGGQHARSTIAVNAGEIYTVTVAGLTLAPSGTNNTNGNTGSFSEVTRLSTTHARANGGAGGINANGTRLGGIGNTIGGIGNVIVRRGGNGGDGTASNSGAGGGGAGTTGNGGNASATTAGTGTSLFGGNGAAGLTTTNPGNPGFNYGGGGSGGRRSDTGGNGAQGFVQISFTCPINTINAGPDQNLTVCSTTATLAGSTITAGTGTWTLISGTATITSPNSSTSGITGIIPGTPVTLRWTIDNGNCGSGFDDVIITSPMGSSCLSYCTPSINATYQPPTNHHIRKVEFIGTLLDITNTSTYSTVTPYGYQDFTALATKSQQAQGEGVNIYFESPNSGYMKAWVDWNKDGDFGDAGETVYDAGGTSLASTTLGFIIPGTAPIGDYRVRLRISGRNLSGSDAGFAWDSCTTNLAYYGETEDYLFTVVASCAAKINTITNGSTCGTNTVTLGATATAGTTQFRWYAAQTGGTQLPGSPTATGSWTTPSISSTTDYWVTAFNGTCESLVRTKVTATIKPVSTLSFITSAPEICGEDTSITLSATGSLEAVNLIDETFESGSLGTFTGTNAQGGNPAGIDTASEWQNKTSPFIPTGTTWFPAIASGLNPNKFAFVNSDVGTCGASCYYTLNNILTSASVPTTNFTALTLDFKLFYDRYYVDGSNTASEYMVVEVSPDGGTTWNNVSGNITSDQGYGTRFKQMSYDLSSATYLNKTAIKVRIRYYTSTWANGAAVDDIQLYGTRPLSPNFTWTGSPVAAYTDASFTTPYISGSTLTGPVYIKPTLTQLETSSYSFTANANLTNGCTTSATINVTNKSKVWKGTTDNDWNKASNWLPVGVPDSSTCVIIPTGTTSQITNTPDALAKNLTIKASTGTLELFSGRNLTVTDFIKVETGATFNVQNSANLVQINNVTNTGNIAYKRNTNVRRQDYIYWSSPVADFASNAVSPGTNLGYQYKWTPTIGGNFGNWTLVNETMVLGKGYCLRAPDAYSLATPAIYTASFVGVPNNGNITTPISRGTYTGAPYLGPASPTLVTKDDDNWNFVGNPYPSAIDAKKFLTLNTNITGFVNIWTHGTLPSAAAADPFYNNYVYNYSQTDYIAYNLTGPSTQNGFNGLIAAGQGFFVSMLDSGASTQNLNFNNDLRRDIPTGNTYNNGQFFKNTDNSKDVNDLEKHRIWLDLVTPSGTSIRSLLGYVENATDGNDRLFDAFTNEKLSFNIFSLIDNEKMLIQGRKLPFDINDKVTIGVSIPQDGLYKIAIASVDGLFLDTNQNIYLEDKLLNITYNLREAPYSFIGKKGITKDRFVLKFAKDIKNTVELINQLSVYDNKVLTIESGKLKIKNIQIFDLLGKELLSKNNINNTTYLVNNLNRTNSLMIVKVTLEDNTEEVRKVIY